MQHFVRYHPGATIGQSAVAALGTRLRGPAHAQFCRRRMHRLQAQELVQYIRNNENLWESLGCITVNGAPLEVGEWSPSGRILRVPLGACGPSGDL